MIKVNNNVIELKRFPDGTLNIKGDSSIKDSDVVISWNYSSDEEYMAVSFLTKFYQASGNDVYLYLPYVPNARMDRVENPNDIFTLKYFGEMINSLNFKKVFVIDTHSSVSIAVIRNCWTIPVDSLFMNVLEIIKEIENETPIIFYPDEGAMKRYSSKCNLPFAFGMKKRDWVTGKILGLDVLGMNENDIKGKNFVIRDDICSKGGTFYYSAKKLKELGAANIYLFVTHCENSVHHGEFGDNKVSLLDTGLITRLFTTNSTYSADGCDMVTIFDMNIE